MASSNGSSASDESFLVRGSGARSLQRTGNYPLHFGRPFQPPVLRHGEELFENATPAIAFDIDGVFKHGGHWDSRGALALRKVIHANIPFVFMTNGGGGRTEPEYITEITQKLTTAEKESGGEHGYDPSACADFELDESHIVISYSPFNTDLVRFKDKPVLIIGDPQEKVMNVAKCYGFEKAIHINDYDKKHPLMNPFKNENTAVDTSEETWEEDIQVICCFTDPLNFFMALQITIDVLLSSRPGEKEYEPEYRIPIYFSNPDLLWKTQYPFGRFGQGAFRLALQSLYVARLHSLGASDEQISTRLNQWIQYGKPEVAQYDFALRALKGQVKDRQVSHYYMVGDNPHSDMQGCLNMNAEAEDPTPWSGILVRTGVFSDGDDENGAEAVVDDVCDAVDYILNKHTPSK